MKNYLFATVLFGIGIAACNAAVFPELQQDLPVNPMTEAESKLAFTCVHELKPEPSAESDVLFNYARWLQKNNQPREDPEINAEMERLYRIAAEHRHYNAHINLQNGAMRRRFQLGSEERLRLSQNLIDAGVAKGYYFVGTFLSNSSFGLQEDEERSLRFFRKAADTGSADAQYLLGDKLARIGRAPAIARQMLRCAAEQGHQDAAFTLGVDLAVNKQHQEAMEVFQLGVAVGNTTSAYTLYNSFRNPPATDETYYLGQQEDRERADRYKKIWLTLTPYSYADLEVPDINDIVPLPPAPLPAWDGKLKWLEAWLANIPPPKPGEALIRKLAKEKALEPATGKPMSGLPAFSQDRLPL